MEDKEREFYFQWITQLMQYNMQLMNNMMALSMQAVRTMPPPMSFSAPSMGPASPNLSAFVPSGDQIDSIMRSMLGMPKKSDEDKLT